MTTFIDFARDHYLYVMETPGEIEAMLSPGSGTFSARFERTGFLKLRKEDGSSVRVNVQQVCCYGPVVVASPGVPA